jgi:hypothetical protein
MNLKQRSATGGQRAVPVPARLDIFSGPQKILEKKF